MVSRTQCSRLLPPCRTCGPPRGCPCVGTLKSGEEAGGCSGAHPPASSPLFNVPTQGQPRGGPQVLQGGSNREHWVRLTINGNNDYFQGTTVGPDRIVWVADYIAQAL